MAGKTAVILVNDADYDAKDETGPFKGKRMTYYGRGTYKFEEAARQGAAGALIVHDTFPAASGFEFFCFRTRNQALLDGFAADYVRVDSLAVV